jgi:FkbM family methyltransferase
MHLLGKEISLRSAGRFLLKRLHKHKGFRSLTFEIAPPNGLLLSGGKEPFLVPAADWIIGRSVYIDQEPYDFDKMLSALHILGGTRDLLIDIGANIDTICIPAVKRNLFERAIAIEPEPRSYSILVANVQINALGHRISTVNVALGAKDGEVPFEIATGNLGDHRVHATSELGTFGEANREIINVRQRSWTKLSETAGQRIF